MGSFSKRYSFDNPRSQAMVYPELIPAQLGYELGRIMDSLHPRQTVSPYHYQPRSNVNFLYVDANGWNQDGGRYINRVYGHAAFEVNGIVYNYTPNGLHLQNKADYIRSVTSVDGKRQSPGQNVYSYPVRMSLQETERLTRQLQIDPGGFDLFQNRTCAGYGRCSLQYAVKGLQPVTPHLNPMSPFLISPSELLDDLKRNGRIDPYQQPVKYPAWDSQGQGFWGFK